MEESKRILTLVKEVNGGNHYTHLRSLCEFTLDEIYDVIGKYPSMAGNFYEVPLLLHYFFRLHKNAGVLVNIDRGRQKAPTKLTSLSTITGGGSSGGAVDITHVDFDDDGVIGITSKYKRKSTLSLADLEYLAVKATIDSEFSKVSNRYYGVSIRDRSQIQHLYKTGELTDDTVVYDFVDMRRFWNEIRIYLKYDDQSLYDIENQINLHHKTHIILRPEQHAGANVATKYLSSKGDEYLLHAKMRYGKIVTSYEIAKRLKARTVLMATFFPAVHIQWEEDAFNFNNYNNIRIINTNKLNNNFIDIEPKNQDEIVVVLASYQDLKDYKSKEKWNFLEHHQFDLLISDEFHFGVESEQTKNLLTSVKFKKHLALSGTPLKSLLRGRFSQENTYTWSYADEQRAKETGLTSYKWLPKMHIHMMHIPSSVQSSFDDYTEDEGFTLNKLFATVDSQFLHEDTVIRFLDMISGTHGFRKELSPYHFGRTENNGLRHTVWYLPDVASTTALESVLSKHPFFKRYDVLAINSKKYGAKDVLDVVRRFCDNSDENESSGSIVLAYRQLNTGSSVPKWSGVFMLNNTQSVETYLQTIFRAQSSYRKGNKKHCHVFDFNPSRCLQILYEYNVTNTESNDGMKVLKEWLEFAPLLSHESNKIVTIDTDEFIKQFVTTGSQTKIFGCDISINENRLTEPLITILTDSKSASINNTFDDISKNDLSQGKNHQHVEKTSTLSEEEVKQIKLKLKYIAQTIPWLLVFTGSKHSILTSLDKLTKRKLKAYEERLELPVSTLKQILNSGALDLSILDAQAEAFNLMFKKHKIAMLSSLSLDSVDDKSIKQYADYPTPLKTVNEMLDRLPDGVWTNPNSTFMDMTCGSGNFLIEIRDRLMLSLGNLIPNKADRVKHILHNMLFGIDIRPSNVELTKLRLKSGRHNTNNIIVGDSTKSTIKELYDVVLSDPPNRFGKYTSFAKKCINLVSPNGHLLMITPPSAIGFGQKQLLDSHFHKYDLQYLATSTIKYNVSLNWDFIWFHIQKTSPTLMFDYTTLCNGITYQGKTELPTELSFIPYGLNHDVMNIMKKLLSVPRLSVISSPQHELNSRNQNLSLIKSKTHQHEYLDTSNNYWERTVYGTELHEEAYTRKVVVCSQGSLNSFYDVGQYGMTYHAYGIPVRSDHQAAIIKRVLDSDLCKFVLQVCNVWGGWRHANSYGMLPEPHNEFLNEIDIYTYLKLSQKEIDMIERYVL